MLELNADCRGSTHNPHLDETEEEEEEALIRVYMLFRPPQSTSGCSMYPAQLPYHLQTDLNMTQHTDGNSWICSYCNCEYIYIYMSIPLLYYAEIDFALLEQRSGQNENTVKFWEGFSKGLG